MNLNNLSNEEKERILKDYCIKHKNTRPPEARLCDIYEVKIPPEVQKKMDEFHNKNKEKYRNYTYEEAVEKFLKK